ncbi:hypothetical protein BGZ61DRAFT_524736 [Ilyonectria robusta]|uniref:uncharacterized protein n=1 Tax=Ilyonectria robusta TaxID=1079257 RepID=UPI001E8D5832|nr:uncharacterized protein BGZ61DRAFT_524736 [Ilyonectria robusta]KAH8649011.1 hypothetical protein BGZ61DRAFT_524736 [Ilyonectria robusta]
MSKISFESHQRHTGHHAHPDGYVCQRRNLHTSRDVDEAPPGAQGGIMARSTKWVTRGSDDDSDWGGVDDELALPGSGQMKERLEVAHGSYYTHTNKRALAQRMCTRMCARREYINRFCVVAESFGINTNYFSLTLRTGVVCTKDLSHQQSGHPLLSTRHSPGVPGGISISVPTIGQMGKRNQFSRIVDTDTGVTFAPETMHATAIHNQTVVARAEAGMRSQVTVEDAASLNRSTRSQTSRERGCPSPTHDLPGSDEPAAEEDAGDRINSDPKAPKRSSI